MLMIHLMWGYADAWSRKNKQMMVGDYCMATFPCGSRGTMGLLGQ